MTGRKVLLIIAHRSKLLFCLSGIMILLSVLLGSILFAHTTTNPLSGRSILIDPGHGGIDGGTGDGAGFLEKDANLEMALKLRDLLQAMNVTTCLTRDRDISLDKRNSLSTSRHKRDLLARVAEINSGKYDLFISIHVNRASNSSAIGPMVLYSGKLQQTRLLSECLKNRLNAHARNALGNKAQHKASSSRYFILSNATIPGALIETGFVSNSREKQLLRSEEYQTRLMQVIIQGLKDYFYKLEHMDEKDLETVPSDMEDMIRPYEIESDVRVVLERELYWE